MFDEWYAQTSFAESVPSASPRKQPTKAVHVSVCPLLIHHSKQPSLRQLRVKEMWRTMSRRKTLYQYLRSQ